MAVKIKKINNKEIPIETIFENISFIENYSQYDFEVFIPPLLIVKQ